MRKARFGELSAYVTGGEDGEGSGDGPLVVLLHGFGAPGYDLVDLGSMLDVPESVRFVFPEAPLAMEGSPGRAWWMLDLELFERRARGEYIDRSAELPPALEAISAQVAKLVEVASEQLNARPEKTVLGGFSQGSMLACDVTLHSAHRPAGLMLLSSTLIASARWQLAMRGSKGLPVYQSHGRRDPILAFSDAERLANLWREAGAELSFVEFPGGHEIPPNVLRTASQFLRATLFPS